MTTHHPDDILARIQASYHQPLTEAQVRDIARHLIFIGANFPGTLSQERTALILQCFPDLVAPSSGKQLASLRKKPRASNRR